MRTDVGSGQDQKVSGGMAKSKLKEKWRQLIVWLGDFSKEISQMGYWFYTNVIFGIV